MSFVWHAAVRRAGLLARVDLLRSTGLRYAFVRRRQNRRWRELRPTPRDAVYRAIWDEAAAELDAELHELTGQMLEVRRNGIAIPVSHQSVPLDGSLPLNVAADKPLVHRLLAEAGLPVPPHLQFVRGDFLPAVSFLAAQSGACVVKPAHGTGAGWGVTPSVLRPSQLRRAILNAARYRRRLLIERQLEGDIYRLLFLDATLVGAVRRRPPTVVGDGRATIRELVARENDRRIAARGDGGLWLLRVDLDCLFTIERAGMRLSTVIPLGQRVAVKTATGENAPADNEDVTDTIPPRLVSLGARAAAAVGLRLAGVDVIDAPPWSGRATATVLEVNGTPGLSHHRLVAHETAAVPIAARILETLFAERTPGATRVESVTPERSKLASRQWSRSL